jgi:hypothetical protein
VSGTATGPRPRPSSRSSPRPRSRRGLTRQLLRTGWTAGRRAEAGGVRFLALLAATLVLVLGTAGMVAAEATYDGRELRDAHRSPRTEPAHPGQRPVARQRAVYDSVDNFQHDVIVLEPLDEAAPPPPGLPRWPKPGEVFLSPALLDTGRGEGIATRYGRLVGTIAAEGLQAPREHFAYVRPRTGLSGPGSEDEEVMPKVYGYGTPSPSGTGESLFVMGREMLRPALLGLVLLPAGVLLVLALRAGAAARDRRGALLTALGGSGRARALFHLGEAAAPIAAGALLAAAVALPAFFRNTKLPVVDFALASADLRRVLPQLLGAAALSVLAVCVLTVLLQPRHRGGGSRSGRRLDLRKRSRSVSRSTSGALRPAGPGRLLRALPWVFPFALLLTVRGAELVPRTYLLPVWVLGTVLTLVTVPSVVALLTAALGRGLVRLGRGRPGLLVAGRRTAAQPQVAARLTAALVIVIGLMAQTQMWVGLLGSQQRSGETALARIGTGLVEAGPYADPARLAAFEAALPVGINLAAAERLNREDGGIETRLTAPCATLRLLDVPCAGPAARTGTRTRTGTEFRQLPAGSGDLRLRAFTGAAEAGTRVSVRTAPVDSLAAHPPSADGERLLLLVSADGRNLDPMALSGIAWHELAAPAWVRPIDRFGLEGSGPSGIAMRWTQLLGTVGVLVVLLAAGLGAMAEYLRFGRELAPLTVLTGRRGIFWTVAGCALLLPSLLAVALGSLVARWLATPVLQDDRASMSMPQLAWPAAAVALAAVALTAWAASSASRAARRWRPSGD